jgi:hypothetical protein
MLKDGIRTILQSQSEKKHVEQEKKLRLAADAERRKREKREAAKQEEAAVAQLEAQFEWVTPEMATQWLTDHNLRNRKMRKSLARKYARMLAQGHWKLTGDAVCFDTEGNLLNGQHRLEAIAQSGVRAHLLVVRGLPAESQLVMDRNLQRQAWESVELEGIVGTNKREEAVARAMKFHGHSGKASVPFEPTDLRNFLIAHLDAINFVLERAATKSVKIMPAPIVAAMARAYYAGKHDRLEQFIEIYVSGMATEAGDRAAILLREFMLANRTTAHRLHASGGEPYRVKQYKKAEAALRAFLEQRPITKLITPKRDELFPLPEEKA